ncbi:hypothetical protein KHQ08_06935 [Pseudochrobactrum algeriensis]|uniref:hypothetical protein n=1 Tax=Pseudochrobactrum algeriensis TaxID=2834768 RepID=UPI000E233EF9|nr:hypothetical protein [Pseudochrobactrum algeriensis]QVQ37750.1 hypothetical protein KHQ08_06935 [Pseudochrobactrum algeriensis]QVQ40970.1 hypothetical protein KHQ07_05235 [Pseudochrobactrum algeriensis]QVQ44894.1 hypothetical protein KHQ09_07200 [Pseudochrobactrum algeriensis]
MKADDLSHLSQEQIDLFLIAISTTAPMDAVAKASGDLLSKAIPIDVRGMLKDIYMRSSEIIALEKAA